MVRVTAGQVLIPRPRLHARLAAAPVVLIEAPGGYGKSVAWEQLAAALDVAAIRVRLAERVETQSLLAALAAGCRRAGLPALAGAIDPNEPDGTLAVLAERLAAGEGNVLIAVDEVQRANESASAWLAALARAIPIGTRLVLAGRRLGPELSVLAGTVRATLLGVDVLRFERDEVAAVLAAARGAPATGAQVDSVLARTEGWPAAVALLAARRGTSGVEPVPDDAESSVLRSLVDELLSAADAETRRVLEMVVELPLLSDATVAAVGGEGALDRLLDAGLPVRFRPDGWGELPDPIRELVARQPLPTASARAVAEDYARRRELAAGLTLLHRAGDPEGIVALLAGQRRHQLVACGVEFLDALLDAVPDRGLAEKPELLVALVRAAERHGRLRTSWTERAMQVLAIGSPARRAVEVERALDGARAGDLEGAVRETGRLLDETMVAETATRGRAHFVRALCLLVLDTAGNARVAAEELEQAIALFDLSEERDWQAEAHQVLGFGCHLTLGAFGLASEHLAIALSLRPAPDAARAGTLTYLAEALTLQGRLEESAVTIREAAAIGRRLGDERTVAYAAWSAADLACQRRDRVGVAAALEEAEAHPGGWFDQLAGTEFLAHAAEMHAILGDREAAQRYLTGAAAVARDGQPPRRLAARVRVEVTFGDPQQALVLLDELDASPLTVRRDRWLGLLFRAVCLARLGRSADAATMLERARLAAAELDDPERINRREPELVAIADPSLAAAPALPTATVILLGRFAVERDGVDATPPPGRPSTLVKLLALQRTVTVDAAIEALWPDGDPDSGPARLRNVLHRVRAASGPIVDRTAGALVLAPGTTVDARQFEDEAAIALKAPPQERAGLARRALGWSGGELLPADRYEDWADAPRERIRRRQLALFDLVAEDAIARGDLDEAGRLLDAAIATDPLEEGRYVSLAQALIAQGRTGRAHRVLDQAVAVAADLGVQPGPELEEVLAAVRVAT